MAKLTIKQLSTELAETHEKLTKALAALDAAKESIAALDARREREYQRGLSLFKKLQAMSTTTTKAPAKKNPIAIKWSNKKAYDAVCAHHNIAH